MTVSTKRPPPIRHPQYGSDMTRLPNQDRLEKPWANYYRDLSTGTIGEANFVDSEVPAGVINGVNVVFALVNAPNPPGSLALYRNGMKLVAGVGYLLAGNTITFLAPQIPAAGDTLEAVYRF
jgi:hypothetical protein